MASFPTLSRPPDFPLTQTWEDSTLATKSDAGYVQTRQRFTKERKKWSFKYTNLTEQDVIDIRAFVTLVKGKADIFTWTDPTNGTSYSVRFEDVVAISIDFYGDQYRGSCDMKLMEV
jgi:hypothetical protein